MSTDDPAAIHAIDKDMAAIREIVEAKTGRVWQRAGDSYLVTFESVHAAVEAAFDVQNWANPADGRSSLLFRVGVHAGDIFVGDGRITGNSVNIASRLEGLADPGGICVSRAVYDQSPSSLRDRLIGTGEARLKNIDTPVEIFRSRRDWRPGHAWPGAGDAPQGAAVHRPSVLVRPFSVLSDDPRAGWLAEGFTADLISRLSRFRRLDVFGKGTSFAISPDSPDRSAGEQVGASYVACGYFQISGAKLRTTATLLETGTERVIWSETYDRDVYDLFDVQGEIADVVVPAMMVKIDTIERDLARARDPGSLDAYGLVVQGRMEELEDGVAGQVATNKAMALYRRAIDLDPHYASAYAGLARAHSVQWRFGWSPDREASMEMATELALHAVQVDDNDAVAHSEFGFVSLYRREHERSLAAYGRALQLNPSDVDVIAFYADALKHAGSPEKAIPMFERALRLNPLHPDIYLSNLAHAHFLLRDFDEAVKTIRRMRQPLTAQRVLTAALMLGGRETEGRREADALRRHLPGFSAAQWCKIVPDRRPEDSDLLREGLERAGF